MKSIAIAALAAICFCAGCALPVQKIPTPQQLATEFCPVVNADLALLSASTILNADQKKTLNDTIIPGNAKVCAAGATIVVDDLKDFNATVFPAVIGLVTLLPNGGEIQLGLMLAQPILTQVINSLPVSTAPAAPASAPVAASA